jgi:hypothetical protein
MTPDSSARAQVDAIVARDGLRLPPDEYERLVASYDETQTLLAALRAPEFASTEPAIVFPAKSLLD